MIQSRKKKGIFIAIIVLLLIVSATSTKLFSTWQKKTLQTTVSQVSPTLAPQRIETGDGSYISATNVPNQMKFVSPKLGISFLYLSKLNPSMPYPQQFLVKEVSNKVYVYDPEFGAYTQGYSVEIFTKYPQDSLETAIQKTILHGYSKERCLFVKALPYAPYVPAYETAIISIPDEVRSSLVDSYKYAQSNCPSSYTKVVGVKYFMMDKKHPDKFAFFNIGQDNLSAEIGSHKPPYDAKSWDETLQFLP